MKIAVIGAGAIGTLVAGYLKLKGEDVILVGRPDAICAINQRGVKISGVRGSFKADIFAHEVLACKPDFAILATKTQDIDSALKSNLDLLKDSVIVTTQNGVRADNIVAGYLPKENIVSSIVMFGSTYLKPAEVVHNFEGSWILGNLFGGKTDAKILSASLLLDKAFPTVISEDILGMKYLKIFVNANNCIPAILGLSMQEAFSDQEVSRISINIWKEGFDIISKAGIKLSSLPGFPLENLTKFISMPSQEAARIFSGIMTKLSRDPLYGSILQSIKRGRSSEIDYINGEFVSLAKGQNLPAALNSKLVNMVHEVEETKRFFSKSVFFNSLKMFLN
ncbi:MAG: 2-dehydropantoate 2-reductase [Candidatus Omnitrophica bacterium]|nr:2-dehydropantoate 2-reductase [Candidatus Omnitrophota bacterium]